MRLLLIVVVSCWLFGCSRSLVHAQVQQALVVEDQVLVQVGTLDAMFEAAVGAMPQDVQGEWRARWIVGRQELERVVDAKDAVLQAALVSSAESVDVAASVQAIMVAVEELIALAARAGVAPALLDEHRAKARRLKVK